MDSGVISALCGVAGVLLTKGFDYIQARRGQDVVDNKAFRDYLLKEVKGLRAEVKAQEAHIDRLERYLRACNRKRSELEAANTVLIAENTQLRTALKEVKGAS